MNRFAFIAAWLLATGLATLIAWQVVGAADDQIATAPLTPVVAVTTPGSEDTAPPSDVTSTSDTRAGSTTVTSLVATTPPSTSSSSTSTPSSSSPSTSSPSTSSPSSTDTTNPSSTSTSTTGVPATTTAVSDGGTVTVTGTEPRVELAGVVAAPGWTYEVTDNDGDRVEVRFENAAGDDIRIRCEWEGGRLVADIDD